jgi:hypothetical protein
MTQGLTQIIHVFSLQVRKRWKDLMVETQTKYWLGRPRRKGDLREIRHGFAKLIIGPHTTNPREEYSCLQRDSNPSSHQSGCCRVMPYTARSLESLPIVRIANMSWDFDSLYLILETCFCDCALCYMLCVLVFYIRNTTFCLSAYISH